MLVLKDAAVAPAEQFDCDEPVYPTAGRCPKRRACDGPFTDQGESCPRCGVEFGGAAGTDEGHVDGYFSRLRPPSSFPTRTVKKWTGNCRWPESYFQDPEPILDYVVEHFDPKTGERVCGAGRR